MSEPAPQPVRDTAAMIAGMAARRRAGAYVFAASDDPAAAALAIGHFDEEEGRSLILPAEAARVLGLPTDQPMACLTLDVHSALDGVGLTAAVAAVLADRSIPANVVAAFRHDHVFVPEAMADRALAALAARAAQAALPAAGQIWSPEGYAAHAGFVPELGAEVLGLLAPTAGESILDLGCGDGVLTARIAAAGARVTGLEPDPAMAAAARGRGIAVLEQDAHDPFGEGAFDAVFSNAALHWMRAPAVVLANAFAALRPGGRLVAEQGGHGNCAAIVTALNAARATRGLAPCAPWDFPSVAGATARLRAAGFAVERIALVPRPTPLPTGLAGWLDTFAGPFVADVAPVDRPGLLAAAQALLPALRDPAAGWVGDYVRLRFAARRPPA